MKRVGKIDSQISSYTRDIKNPSSRMPDDFYIHSFIIKIMDIIYNSRKIFFTRYNRKVKIILRINIFSEFSINFLR